MKNTFILFICQLFSLLANAQPTIVEPGDESINTSFLTQGKFTWATEKLDEDLFVSVQQNSNEIYIKRLEIKKGVEGNSQIITLNAKTLEPISEIYKGEEVAYTLNYSKKVKGDRTIYDTNEKETIDEAIPGKYFVKESLPFVISCLPLSVGYKVTLPVLNVTNSFKPEYLRYKITDVSDEKSFSCFTGIHEIWKVTVIEKSKNLEITLYIDKHTRKIGRLEYNYTQHITKYVFADTEADFNPIKAKFNADETKALLFSGTSKIKGKAYTTDGKPKSILEKKKKLYAPKGSLVVLIPNTAYYKEWMDYNLNKHQTVFQGYSGNEINLSIERGQKCVYPLPEEIKKYHLLTDVVDEKGSFEFQNIKAGEYLVFVSFVADIYTHTTRTPNGSYNITINQNGSGSATQNVDVTHWAKAQKLTLYELVKISKEGELVNIELK